MQGDGQHGTHMGFGDVLDHDGYMIVPHPALPSEVVVKRWFSLTQVIAFTAGPGVGCMSPG